MNAQNKVFLIFLIILSFNSAFTQDKTQLGKINEIVMPFVNTNNFSGIVSVTQQGKVLFEKAYGEMSKEYSLSNTINTKFFLASASMIFTSTAIMKLVEEGSLSLDDKLSKFIPDYKRGNEITVHHLLAQRSGIPTISDVHENYNNMIKFSHTPVSLISYFKDHDLIFTPGTKYNHARSDYIILAYIIEQVSGKSFGDYLRDEIFILLGMYDTGHYSNEKIIIKNLAKGYATKDLYDLESASQLDWSSKTGHASVYSTVGDLQIFAEAVFENKILNNNSWEKVFTNYGSDVGYGWFIYPKFGRKRYYMIGRSPGFSSYFGIFPEDKISVTILSNIYNSVPGYIHTPITAAILNEPYELLTLSKKKVDKQFSEKLTGTYLFDESFYQPDYKLNVSFENGKLTTQWGDLIPVDLWSENFEYFILRTYWSSIHFIKDSTGTYNVMKFDKYSGAKIK